MQIFIILLLSISLIEAHALEFDCWSECRFFKPSCKQGENKRTLSSDSKKPSKILTDSIVYCDVEGKSTEKQSITYKLSMTDNKGELRLIKEKIISLNKGDPIKPLLKYSNFTFSNPNKGQKVRVEMGKIGKDFFFDGIPVH